MFCSCSVVKLLVSLAKNDQNEKAKLIVKTAHLKRRGKNITFVENNGKYVPHLHGNYCISKNKQYLTTSRLKTCFEV